MAEVVGCSGWLRRSCGFQQLNAGGKLAEGAA